MSGESRLDRRTGATLILAPDGLKVLRTGAAGFIPAPEGFSLSHFSEDAILVGRGAAPIDGWWDWHFEADVEAGLLRRLGPAY
jgi:hypothetical protein